MVLNWLSPRAKMANYIRLPKSEKDKLSTIKCLIQVKGTKKHFTLRIVPDALFGPKRHSFWGMNPGTMNPGQTERSPISRRET